MGKQMIERSLSYYHLPLWGLFLAAILIRGYDLSGQPPLDDEIAVAFDALNYMETGQWSRVMWEHPPLRNISVYLSSALFGGYTAWGLRFGSVIFGSLTIPALGYLAYSLFQKRLIAYLSAFFLCVDPLHISLSRQAFQETTTAFFIICGVISAYHGIKRDNFYLCCFSGLLFGLSASSKWHGLFPWAVSAFAYVGAPWFIDNYTGERRMHLRLLYGLASFLAAPLFAYVSVFIPWINRGHSIGEFVQFHLFLVKANYFHKAAHYAEEFLSRRAYLWFLAPLGWVSFVFSSGKPFVNIAMGNFLVWVLTLPSLLYSVRQWLMQKRFELGYLLGLFLISYIPLLLTSRGIWVFNSLSVIPFAFIISAFAICGLIENSIISVRTLFLYVFIVCLVSGIMYPMSTFRALEFRFLKPVAEFYSPHFDSIRSVDLGK